MEPKYAKAYIYRAYVNYDMKYYEEAMKDCNQQMKTMTVLPDVYYVRALLYLTEGKIDLAIQDLKTCLTTKTDKTRIFPIAKVEACLKKYETTKPELQK